MYKGNTVFIVFVRLFVRRFVRLFVRLFVTTGEVPLHHGASLSEQHVADLKFCHGTNHAKQQGLASFLGLPPFTFRLSSQ